MTTSQIPRSERFDTTSSTETDAEWPPLPSPEFLQALGERANDAEFLPWPEMVKGPYDDVRQLLHERIVGQREPIEAIVKALEQSEIQVGGRPIATLMFLGPTGVGKTEVAKVLAEALNARGHKTNMVTIDCASLTGEHDGPAFLLGSPAGYIGYGDTPKLHQQNFASPDSDERTVLLLDELEKAHPGALKALFPLIDEGRVSLKNGQETYFGNTIVIATSNVGAAEMSHALEGPAGFASASRQPGANRQEIVSAALRGYKKHFDFMPEFSGRFPPPIVFESHTPESLQQIAGVTLARHNEQLRQRYGVEVAMSDATVARLIRQTESQSHLGARPLIKEIDREVLSPAGRYIGSGYVREGYRLYVYDSSEFDLPDQDRLVFARRKDASLQRANKPGTEMYACNVYTEMLKELEQQEPDQQGTTEEPEA